MPQFFREVTRDARRPWNSGNQRSISMRSSSVKWYENEGLVACSLCACSCVCVFLCDTAVLVLEVLEV